jgi:hypothetical protein
LQTEFNTDHGLSSARALEFQSIDICGGSRLSARRLQTSSTFSVIVAAAAWSASRQLVSFVYATVHQQNCSLPP